jgi:hypothetical protein
MSIRIKNTNSVGLTPIKMWIAMWDILITPESEPTSLDLTNSKH